MKTNPATILTAAIVLTCFSVAHAQTPAASGPQKQPVGKSGVTAGARLARSIQEIKKPPLPPFHPQQPKKIQLENGMVIFLQEDHELPLVDGFARIRGGEREVPAEKTGMAGIYGQVWRTGGTKNRTGDELDDFLESRAAQVETSGGIDSTTIGFSSLKGDFDDVFAVFMDLLENPEFREDKLDLAKKQAAGGISRRNDNIGGIAGREAAKLGYGADNPYARQSEYWTINSITRQDLLDWHSRYVHPHNIILGISGDFDATAMEAKLRAAFSAWKKGPALEPAKIEFRETKPGIYFIPKDDVNQSSITFVALGTTIDNPDYFAISVMNQLFGGGFGTRLLDNIRSKKGLAYSVGGGIGSSYDHPGLFRLAMGTKSGTTAEAITALNEEIAHLIKDPGSEVEVRRAKDSILNSFVFRFDSKDKVMREKMAYEFYGYPLDFLEKYRAAIEKVAPADVARVVKKYVEGRKFAVLVVGKSSDFDRPLSSFGTVETINITIPQEPPAKAGAATSERITSNEEGKLLIAKVVQAMGGEDKLQSLKSMALKASILRKSPQGDVTVDIENTLVFPDKLLTVMRMPFGEITTVVSREVAFMRIPGQGIRDLPASMKEDSEKDSMRNPQLVAMHAKDANYAFRASGTQKVGDITATVLDVNADGVPIRWFVDAASGQILRASYKASSPTGPVTREVDFSDYRPVDGLMVSFLRVTKDNGELAFSTQVREVQINPAVDEKAFRKPAE